MRVDKHLWLAQAQSFHHLRVVHRLAESADILTVGGDHATGADDADLTVTVEQFKCAGFAVFLQRGEVDVEADHGDDFAVFQQRESDAGHQFSTARSLVEIGLQHTGLTGVAGAGIEGVVRSAARAGLGVGQQAFVADHCLQFTGFALHPVQRETTGFVAAQIRFVDETGVGAVQGIGFKNDVKPEQVGLVDQGLMKLGTQLPA
ncbi:hypothetical protein D3C87_1140160 [compost metagenome]